MGQMRLALAHEREGETPTGVAHRFPPNLPNPQTQSSAIWEPESIDPKALVRTHQARRPVADEGACTRSSVVIVDLDNYIGSALQLEREQNIHSPDVGSVLNAAPSVFRSFSFLPIPPVPSPFVSSHARIRHIGKVPPPNGARPTSALGR